MNIAIGSDHGGFFYKEYIKENLKNVNFVDVGALNQDSEDDYTDFSFAVAESVKNKSADLGIMICRTGVGAVIAMNKVFGIRAGVCESENAVTLARHKNNINCLSFGADNISKEEALKICEIFIREPFDGGRHLRRINKILSYEEKCNAKG